MGQSVFLGTDTKGGGRTIKMAAFEPWVARRIAMGLLSAADHAEGIPQRGSCVRDHHVETLVAAGIAPDVARKAIFALFSIDESSEDFVDRAT